MTEIHLILTLMRVRALTLRLLTVLYWLPCAARASCSSRCHGRGLPGGELSELVDGSLSLLNQPVHGLAGPVVSEPILNIVELNRRIGREANSPVPRALGSADFAVTVFPTGGPDNVASLDLHDLSATASASYPESGGGSDSHGDRSLVVFMGLPHLLGIFIGGRGLEDVRPLLWWLPLRVLRRRVL